MQREWAEICSKLPSRTLFYPMAGQDIEGPINTFLPFVDHFWFVDIRYRVPGEPLLKNYGRRGNRSTPLWKKWKFLESASNVKVETGVTIKSQSPFEVQIRDEVYECRESGRRIHVYKCKGMGYNVFRIAFRLTDRKLSVFFHRGDSPGEGGSDFYWLRGKVTRYVFEELDPGGVVVSDGSLAKKGFKVRFQEAGAQGGDRIGPRTLDLLKPFHLAGRNLNCVGYLCGSESRPTLAWQATECSDT